MTPDSFVYSLKHLCERRLIRVGACPVLEITVTYPELSGVEPADSVEAFNSTYRRMTEAFLYWGETAFGEQAARDFGNEGVEAAFRFDRRVLVCRMEAEILGDGGQDGVRVVRSVWTGTRRGGRQTVLPEAVDTWRLPQLTLQPPSRRLSKKS